MVTKIRLLYAKQHGMIMKLLMLLWVAYATVFSLKCFGLISTSWWIITAPLWFPITLVFGILEILIFIYILTFFKTKK